jgi:hypothetical protein
MAAREAYAVQDPGISFDEWRAEAVMAAVGRPGITACENRHFCDLMGYFKTAAGKDDAAFSHHMRAGKDIERQLAWSIARTLADHIALANSTPDQLATSTTPRRLKTLLAKRAALLDHPDGPLTAEYLASIVRDKTRRPTLTLGPDIQAALAERCTARELTQIRFTLVNRIAEREGRGLTQDRNKSQKSEAAKRRRSPHELSPRPGVLD